MKFKILILIMLLAGSLLYGNDWLGRDKVAHFSTSMFLTCYTCGGSNDLLGESRDNSFLLGTGITFSIGLGKEGFDLFVQKEKWSWEDLVWDVAGIACGLAIVNNQIME
ncbi:MAG: hypothetical protein K9M99_04130 [Candidatus Cloacimonetes bacterium]|nr:hypothetical protein [Candidatus Cloacimonadota bacterium]